VKPYLISEIRDSEGKILYRAEPEVACENCGENEGTPQPAASKAGDAQSVEDLALPVTRKPAERIMDPRVAFLIDNILKDVVGPAGTGHKVMELKRTDLAGKTGTTNGPTDAWFAGYHPNVVTTVWMGFNNNSTLGSNEYGGSSAVPIWMEFMKTALAEQPVVRRTIPAGIVTILINRDTGKLAQPGEENTLQEYIQEELLPAFSVQEGSSDTSAESIEEIF
jgi:penicillin-binding protein 1A